MKAYRVTSPYSLDVYVNAPTYDEALHRFSQQLGFKDYFEFLRDKGLAATQVVQISYVYEERSYH